MRELVRRRGLSFPVLALLLVCFFTALGWSGTSSGALRRAVTGSAADDHVVAGQPREVRSDEWLVATPLTLSQAERGLPRVNPTLGAGNDVSLPFWAAPRFPDRLIGGFYAAVCRFKYPL